MEDLLESQPQPGVVFSDGVVGPGKAFFAALVAQGLEGMMAKHLASRYRPGRRSAAWLKIKPVGAPRQGGGDSFGFVALSRPNS